MGKQAIKLKEVIYTLSPFEQSVMSGLAKDMPHKAAHYFKSVSHQSRVGDAASPRALARSCAAWSGDRRSCRAT
jgi:hypothetical protein